MISFFLIKMNDDVCFNCGYMFEVSSLKEGEKICPECKEYKNTSIRNTNVNATFKSELIKFQCEKKDNIFSDFIKRYPNYKEKIKKEF